MSFTKLFENILESSVWAAPDDFFRAWIALLAKAGPDGVARISATWIAEKCHVPIERAREILAEMEGPDKDSRSENDDGQRIQRIDGGYYIINYLKYREMRDDTERKKQIREAVQRFRDKQKQPLRECNQDVIRCKHDVNTGKPLKAQAEAEAEAEKERIYKKENCGEFKNVLLTITEKEKVSSDEIEALSSYIASTGKKYKSHYATILNWRRKNGDPKRLKWK